MATSYRDAAVGTSRGRRGSGSVRQRSPGVWEIRVVVGFDAVRGRSVQRSFTVHGNEDFVECVDVPPSGVEAGGIHR
ncbi:MAG TPA: hypothetical protein VK988_18800 [Acidimicrobiales bacterium]|nr:hypothetical protein [Acidimicrobiales bacterium]